MRETDIAVIGAGASGLAAAVSAYRQCEREKQAVRILVLEAQERPGRKLLATGNGRCNLSHRDIRPEDYHGDPEWIRLLLKSCPEKEVRRFFQELGLVCREDEEGRIYPYSRQASSVLDALRMQAEQSGAEILCGFAVRELTATEGGFRISSGGGETVKARRVILAAGGKAAPQLGATGDGGLLAGRLGHTVHREEPALAPLVCKGPFCRMLRGVRSPGTATLLADGQAVRRETGEIQFTEYGLSGICIFQLSRYAGQALQEGQRTEVSLDLMPDWTTDRITKLIAGQAKRCPQLESDRILFGVLNRTLGQAVVRSVLEDRRSSPAGSLSFEDCGKIADRIRDFRFVVEAVRDWRDAQVTAGGVDLRETDVRTMGSRKVKGLYLCGELLDADGICGGYNLHFAWTTGITAGRACASSLQEAGA